MQDALEEIDEATFAAKNTELRDRIAQLSLQLDVSDRSRAERGEVALKVFELFPRWRNPCPHNQKAL